MSGRRICRISKIQTAQPKSHLRELTCWIGDIAAVGQEFAVKLRVQFSAIPERSYVSAAYN